MKKPIVLWLGLAALGACGDTVSPPVGDPPCSTPLSLARGEVRQLSGSAAVSCVVVARHAEASEYLFIAANATAVQDDLRSYMVSALSGTSTTVMNSRLAAAAQAGEPVDFRTAFEDRLRDAEQKRIGNRSLAALGSASRAARVKKQSEVPVAAAAAVPSVGDTLSYRVGDAASSNMCTNYQNIRAVVKAIGTKALIVQDVAAPAGGFTVPDFQEMAAEFDGVVYPVDAQWFGTPTDINADGRITVLFTPAINKLTPTGSLGYAGGFFYSADLLARSIPAQNWTCDASNEQEILYLLVPDPNGQVNGNRFSVNTARESSRGTTAHELQHMINQGVRQTLSSSTRLEVKWLNEGLSHFAEEAVGRAVRSYSDGRRLTWNEVLVDLDDFDSFFRQNLLRFRFWMQRPDLSSPISELAGTQLAPRGAAWALVRYSIDQYSNGDARAFTRALVAGPLTDVPNLEARARVAFDQILPGFLVANFADTNVTNLAARYRYSSWAMRDVMTTVNGGVSPLRVVQIPGESNTQSLSGSGNYFLLARAAGADAATFRMLSLGGGSVGFAEARVYVVRIK